MGPSLPPAGVPKAKALTLRLEGMAAVREAIEGGSGEPFAAGERPPQPALTALIASRVDAFQPVFKEATHGSTGRPAEVC